MAVNDVWGLRLEGLQQNQKTYNILWYVQTGAGNDSDTADTLTEFAEDDLMTVLNLAQSGGYKYTAAVAQKVFPVQMAQVVLGVDKAGAIDQAPQPLTVTMNIKKLTPLAGKKYRGRTYFAGAPVNGIEVTNGLWSDAQAILMNDIATMMLTYVGIDDFGPHLYPALFHKSDNTTTRITNCVLDRTPRVQRRREIGHGI